ncbi:hypothetical protein [Gracilibacillus boraciitolerans]|uniref:hypothetical protein n=1 Tax=Gracilibacillus boraciitolerans TaxID=307521 RepID=UPI001F44F3D7|nr:hypothetical protein [Gracilibacillus boraciitolerans]
MSEGSNYQFREFNFQLEQVINDQRKVIYEIRNKLLHSKNIIADINDFIDPVVQTHLTKHIDHNEVPDQQTLTAFLKWLDRALLVKVATETTFEDYHTLQAFVTEQVNEHLAIVDTLKRNLRLEKSLRHGALQLIDQTWTAHLEEMGRLKDGIAMRSYEQEDPVQIYTKEGYQIFKWMYESMQTNIHMLFVQTYRYIINRNEQ